MIRVSYAYDARMIRVSYVKIYASGTVFLGKRYIPGEENGYARVLLWSVVFFRINLLPHDPPKIPNISSNYVFAQKNKVTI